MNLFTSFTFGLQKKKLIKKINKKKAVKQQKSYHNALHVFDVEYHASKVREKLKTCTLFCKICLVLALKEQQFRHLMCYSPNQCLIGSQS